MTDIAELETVPLRVAFPHEAQSFTPWLSGNLHRLAEAIAVPMTLMDARAVAEGQFVDLLARDERDGSVVLIENQLEPADDAHLGQILGYVGGIDARTVVWVAERFAEPHLSAIRWLNAKSALNFFAVGCGSSGSAAHSWRRCSRWSSGRTDGNGPYAP